MISLSAQDTLFRNARSHNGWSTRPVSDEELRAVYELLKWGPTSANCSPMRLQFVRTGAGRERLLPWLAPGNVEKTMSAPVTVIVGIDYEFQRLLPRLFPHNPNAQASFLGPENEAHAARTAVRNATLQAGYLIIAARAVGLDCGPMSGFNADGVDRAFWGGTKVRTDLLCNLGHGDPSKLYERHPRLTFDEACTLA